MSSQSDILFERRGAAGLVVLNRPQALNALTGEMIRALAARLTAWARDPAVTRVVVTAEGKAFSAGGDLRQVYALGRAGKQDEALTFFRDEYALNALIKRYPKPYVACIDGIVMGGGAGISINGSHRVAGDAFLFAMPEVGIGFFPDVGATWFLSHLPGELGPFCALTGARLAAADACAAGIATHRVPSARFPELVDALCGNVPVDSILAAFSTAAGQGPLAARRFSIDRLFAAETVEAILSRLDIAATGRDEEGRWAAETAADIRAKAPLSLKIALAQMRRAPNWSFEECMQAEFRIVSRVVHGHDFYEGIRATIIDKDGAPHWSPARLADVSEAEVARHFAPLTRELVLS